MFFKVGDKVEILTHYYRNVVGKIIDTTTYDYMLVKFKNGSISAFYPNELVKTCGRMT